jgi:sugar O-acyltransferase (sialic acid O-acetyltransferase NeuD family)
MLGAGGHASVLLDSIARRSDIVVRFILDANPTNWGKKFCGVLVLGGDNLVSSASREGISHFIIGVGAVGNNSPRRELFKLALSHGLQPLSIVHSSATCSEQVSIGEGAQILAGAIVNCGVFLGRNTIVNTGAIIEHDCQIGDHVHIATGARLGGCVTVEEEAHIGLGASIRQGIKIGKCAIVGAGATVVKHVDDGVTVAGVPARPLKA